MPARVSAADAGARLSVLRLRGLLSVGGRGAQLPAQGEHVALLLRLLPRGEAAVPEPLGFAGALGRKSNDRVTGSHPAFSWERARGLSERVGVGLPRSRDGHGAPPAGNPTPESTESLAASLRIYPHGRVLHAMGLHNWTILRQKIRSSSLGRSPGPRTVRAPALASSAPAPPQGDPPGYRKDPA
jgi:hypothetical protein